MFRRYARIALGARAILLWCAGDLVGRRLVGEQGPAGEAVTLAANRRVEISYRAVARAQRSVAWRIMSMHIGIDLAWSLRARTGLAAVDEDGALVTSTSVVTDEQIDDWLAGLGAPVISVAIDAPLIVTNPTGMRQCERLIGRAYGAYEASCHASNLGNPHFNPPRAAVLAKRHGWKTDPDHRASATEPAAIEVYPHPAMVGLFELGRTLKYKKGPVASRRQAMVQVLDRMGELQPLVLTGSVRWRHLRTEAQRAGRQVDLNLIEDEVDAILCAHLAWLWHHRPGVLQVYGDAADGYIIAPPPPVHPPAPRGSSRPGGAPSSPRHREPSRAIETWLKARPLFSQEPTGNSTSGRGT